MAAPDFSAAPATPHRPSHDEMRQAAEWFALLRSGEASEQDRDDWSRWLAQRGSHRAAWSYVENIGRRFEPAQAAPRAAVSALQGARDKALKRRQVLSGMAALAGTGLLAWSGLRDTDLPAMALAWRADFHTGSGEVRQIALADGSQVWLNAASALDADFQPGLRRLQLLRGEILVDTAADGQRRPFVVDTAAGRLRALGTRFAMRLAPGGAEVAVYQGAVELSSAGKGGRRIIEAGQQSSFSSDHIAAPEPARQARQAWSRGVLLAENIPLGELVRELGRYRHGHLGLVPELARLRVLGAYPLHDTDQVLSMLEQVLPIRVRRILPWWVTIEAR